MLDRKLFSSLTKSAEPRLSLPPVFPLPRLDGQPPVLLVFNHVDLAVDIAYERSHVPGSPLVRTSTRDSALYWVPRTTPVFAVSDGVVIDQLDEEHGQRLIVDHENSWFTIYGNLARVLARPREHRAQIRAGDPIGCLADTRAGPLTPLHFELWRINRHRDYEQIDPIRHMRRWQQVAWRDDPLPCQAKAV